MNNINSLCECTICYEPIKNYIYQCENGHLYCDICINNINHCGTCRSNNYKIRNLVLESLRDSKIKTNYNDKNEKTENNNNNDNKIYLNLIKNYNQYKYLVD